MNRREFLKSSSLIPLSVGASCALSPETGAEPSPTPPPLSFQTEKSGLKITGVRAVSPRPRQPRVSYRPAPGSWSTGAVEVANPMSIYPEYKPRRSLFMAEGLGSEAVEITTDKGVTGIGFGGPGGGFVVESGVAEIVAGRRWLFFLALLSSVSSVRGKARSERFLAEGLFSP